MCLFPLDVEAKRLRFIKAPIISFHWHKFPYKLLYPGVMGKEEKGGGAGRKRGERRRKGEGRGGREGKGGEGGRGWEEEGGRVEDRT